MALECPHRSNHTLDMRDLTQIAGDYTWLPHEIDWKRKRIRFLKLEPSQFTSRDFLVNLEKAKAEAWIGFDHVLRMPLVDGPVRFIFHSGFCRSTLLLQSLSVPGKTASLNEPGILNSLARIGQVDQQLVDRLVRLLARPHSEGAPVIIKPSNYPNRLIPALMRSSPKAGAIIITNDLESFLNAVVRKGLLGRQWARQLCLETRHYALPSGGFDLEMLAGLTDLQLAGLAWLYLQNWFTDCLHGPEGNRIKVIDSGYFNANRERTIAAAAAHLGLSFDKTTINSIIDGPVFRSHSKLGVDYNEKKRQDRERSFSVVTDEEVASVAGWIGEIARVSRLVAPVPQTLVASNA